MSGLPNHCSIPSNTSSPPSHTHPKHSLLPASRLAPRILMLVLYVGHESSTCPCATPWSFCPVHLRSTTAVPMASLTCSCTLCLVFSCRPIISSSTFARAAPCPFGRAWSGLDGPAIEAPVHYTTHTHPFTPSLPAHHPPTHSVRRRLAAASSSIPPPPAALSSSPLAQSKQGLHTVACPSLHS